MMRQNEQKVGQDSILVVLIPVFNDWHAVGMLLDAIDNIAGMLHWRTQVLLVDDGSTEPALNAALQKERRYLVSCSLLRLRRNLGHQRAIAIGLAYIDENVECAAVLVMDGDGEDDPQDIVRLVGKLESLESACVVFAERTRRSEGVIFNFFYILYRYLHRILTGIPVRVGNFSVMSRLALRRLAVMSDLWNHYAASVFKARIEIRKIPTTRAERLSGTPKMNFVGLVMHGLSAISVFGDRVGVRMVISTASILVVALLGLFTVIALRALTDIAIPGWTSYVALGLILLVFQLLLMISGFAFVILASRDSSSFLPARDYAVFVDSVVRLFSKPILEPTPRVLD